MDNRKMKPYHTERRKTQKSLEEVYKQLNRDYVKIKKRDRRCNNIILYSVLEELLRIMQDQNKLFRSMKPKIEYLGSYYDGLRVGQPTEYDINILLKLPVNYKNICLDASKTGSHDTTHIYMSSEFRRLSIIPATAKKGFSETEMWCDNRYRLSVEKFRSWMQKVVDTAIGMLPIVNSKRIISAKTKPYLITTKMSGPAFTITILKGSLKNVSIDVDLVPTFAFELSKKPIGSLVLFERVEAVKVKDKNKKYFVVPKPSDDEFSWRLAFPFQERHCIKGKNNLKSSAKLIKLLRDTQDFKLLASYYIKTIYLWEVDNQRNDEFWTKNSLAYLVLHMLKKLRDSLAKGEIKNFWCPDANLIKGKIKPETCINWSNRLSIIIKYIELKKDPCVVADYFRSRIQY